VTLAAQTLARLPDSFAGEVILPEDSGYQGARRSWNAMVDRRPGAIVRPSSVAEVQAAIRFARDHDLELAIRCGGHSSHSSTDGGILLDLGRLRGVSVDPASRIARVNGGALLSELDTAAQEHGLVCPVGVVGHTGVAGLTLGGGMGRLQRKFGLTFDCLRAVELVTADGRVIRASETEQPELFWAIRGAGANFGVVTSFEFELHPFGGTLHRGTRIYAGSDIHAVWSMLDGAADGLADDISLVVVIARAEPASDYPDGIGGRPVVIIGYNHCGDASAVERDLAFLDGGPAPAIRSDTSMRYLDVQVSGDESMGWGKRSYITGGMTNGLRPESLDALIAHVERAPAPECGFGLTVQRGAIARVPDEATAWPARDARFEMSADAGTWEDPALDKAVIEWCQQTMAIVASDAAPGRYVNEVSETGDDVVRSIYGDVVYRRLAGLKRAWDPDNLFRLNHNVPPATAAPAG
jgi:FAD/FMN-containing dehydrogenase